MAETKILINTPKSENKPIQISEPQLKEKMVEISTQNQVSQDKPLKKSKRNTKSYKKPVVCSRKPARGSRKPGKRSNKNVKNSNKPAERSENIGGKSKIPSARGHAKLTVKTRGKMGRPPKGKLYTKHIIDTNIPLRRGIFRKFRRLFE